MGSDERCWGAGFDELGVATPGDLLLVHDVVVLQGLLQNPEHATHDNDSAHPSEDRYDEPLVDAEVSWH